MFLTLFEQEPVIISTVSEMFVLKHSDERCENRCEL